MAVSVATQAAVQQRLSGLLTVVRQLVKSAMVEAYAPQARWITHDSDLTQTERRQIEWLAEQVMATGEVILIDNVQDLPQPQRAQQLASHGSAIAPLQFFAGFPVGMPPQTLGVVMIMTRAEFSLALDQQQAIATLATEMGSLLETVTLTAVSSESEQPATGTAAASSTTDHLPLTSPDYHNVMRLSMALQSCLTFEDLTNQLVTLLPVILPIHAFEVALNVEHHKSQRLCFWSDETVKIPHSDELVCQLPKQLNVHALKTEHRAANTRTPIAPQDINAPASPLPPYYYWRCYQLAVHNRSVGSLKLCLKPAAAHAFPVENSILDYVADQISVTLRRLVLLRKLQAENLQDPLTKLFNRRHMMSVLSKLLQRVSYGRYQVGLIMLDLDHFKQLNDTYGHDAGDHVLSMMGLFLKGHARPNDVVCRFGGEEFVLILPGVTWPILERRARQLCRSLHYLNVKVGETTVQITLSAGFAIAPLHAKTPATLIKAADTALYEAKCQGRDRAVGAPLPPASETGV
ncbi:GGDEF domain-containing protein [Leptolyngbya iicbica]|uniref:GGDEF domain-containing protein n=1 Tax=Lyngbya confervoides BDU141951 TaxID=1574623 RepID=A0A8T6QS96_9CYAN|nr:GGDEF domain-containing protein [Leptolyngbya sp. LK]